MSYQGMLDNCNDIDISAIDLEETQAPLKTSIKSPGKSRKENKNTLVTFLSISYTALASIN